MPKEKFESYLDTSGDFSNKSLLRAEFYLKNKVLFRNIFIGVLLTWCIFSILFSLIYLGKYFVFDYSNDQLNSIKMVKVGISPSIIEKNKPQDLILGQKYVFPSSKDKYDFGIEVTNPNKAWMAELSYSVVYQGGQSLGKKVVFLPGDRKFVLELGINSPGTVPGNMQFNLLNVSWRRLDAHEIPDPIDYIKQRVNFSLENISFESFGGSGVSSGRLLTFDVINKTLFGYKEAKFNVLLKSSGNIVGFMPLYISDFASLSTQNIQVSLFNNTLSVDSVELQPIINVFDGSIYMSL
ncbi:MAG: hypothetical protein ACD_18C00290G0003 [uncultured bacterium]|nr:MAG: hypothetical protein ACD_18C00290G0003 [uncultured bacterium]